MLKGEHVVISSNSALAMPGVHELLNLKGEHVVISSNSALAMPGVHELLN